MKTQQEKSRIDISALLPAVELPLKAGVEQLGREMMAQGDGEDADTDPIEYYGEWYMEDLSEAGYSETRPDDRLSLRAFGHLLRAKPDDLKWLRDLLGYGGDVYCDFAVCDTAIGVLARNADVAPVLSFIAPPDEAKAKGPFYPTQQELDLAEAVEAAASLDCKGTKLTGEQAVGRYLERMVELHGQVSGNPSVVDEAAVKLAGMIRITEDSLASVADALKSAGALPGNSLTVTLAYVVLDSLRASPRLTYGLERAQPKDE
jgi:hypothetical protein